MPTLLDLADIPIPAAVEGISVADGARGAEFCGRDTTFIHNTCPFIDPIPEWRGVRTTRYTYARTLQGPWMLYDNEADPYQMNNLVDTPQMQEIQKSLDDAVYDWLQEIGDDFQPREVYWERHGFDVNEVGHIKITEENGI